MTVRTRADRAENEKLHGARPQGAPPSAVAGHPSVSMERVIAGALAPHDVLHLQRTVGNRVVAGLLSRGAGRLQRVVVEDGSNATVEDVKQWAGDNDVELELSDQELEQELEEESGFPDEIDIEAFLKKIGALEDEMEEEDDDDDDWDPADHAADPLDADDILSSDVRKSLGFRAEAKKYMKTDTPQKHGTYVCHICGMPITKGQPVDMDHLPPWKERLAAFITEEQLSEDDRDELTGPRMNHLYNMRGSVFAHSSCNRGHSGEGNYKKKWGTASKWYTAGGGPPF